MDTIYIIGAGAIGKVLATCLKANNRKVVLLRGSVDNGHSYNKNISVTLPDQQTIEADVEISTLSNFENLKGIIVLTNKSYGNARLAAILKDKTSDSPVIILQNGLGVEQAFIDADFPAIYRCVLFATSQPIDEYKLNFKPVSFCPIGVIKGGNIPELNHIVDLLNTHVFRFKSENEIQPVIWKKAIINIVFNSICPLLDVDNGIFQRNEQALMMAKRVVKECLVITEGKNIFLDEEDVMASLMLISRSSDGQFISTLQDIRKNRQTEIDTLNFAIVKLAESMNKGNVVSETRLLGELTLLKSNLNEIIPK